jgi:hypothetical protein
MILFFYVRKLLTAVIMLLSTISLGAHADSTVSGTVLLGSGTTANLSTNNNYLELTPTFPDRNESNEIAKFLSVMSVATLSADQIDNFLSLLSIQSSRDGLAYIESLTTPQKVSAYGEGTEYLRSLRSKLIAPISRSLTIELEGEYRGSDDIVQTDWESKLSYQINNSPMSIHVGYGRDRGHAYPRLFYIETDLQKKFFGLELQDSSVGRIAARLEKNWGTRDYGDLLLEVSPNYYDVMNMSIIDFTDLLFPYAYNSTTKEINADLYTTDYLTISTKNSWTNFDNTSAYTTNIRIGCINLPECIYPIGQGSTTKSYKYSLKEISTTFYGSENTSYKAAFVRNTKYGTNRYSINHKFLGNRYRIGATFDTNEDFLGFSLRIDFGGKRSLRASDRGGPS